MTCLLQGSTCEVDVNECAVLTGTDLGCKNGATCVNSPGTYQYVFISIENLHTLMNSSKCFQILEGLHLNEMYFKFDMNSFQVSVSSKLLWYTMQWNTQWLYWCECTGIMWTWYLCESTSGSRWTGQFDANSKTTSLNWYYCLSNNEVIVSYSYSPTLWK